MDAAIKRYEDADLKAAQEAFDELMDTIKSDLFYSTLFGASVFSTKKGTMRRTFEKRKQTVFSELERWDHRIKALKIMLRSCFTFPLLRDS